MGEIPRCLFKGFQLLSQIGERLQTCISDGNCFPELKGSLMIVIFPCVKNNSAYFFQSSSLIVTFIVCIFFVYFLTSLTFFIIIWLLVAQIDCKMMTAQVVLHLTFFWKSVKDIFLCYQIRFCFKKNCLSSIINDGNLSRGDTHRQNNTVTHLIFLYLRCLWEDY